MKPPLTLEQQAEVLKALHELIDFLSAVMSLPPDEATDLLTNHGDDALENAQNSLK